MTNTSVQKMPPFILRSVHKKNIKFLHHRHHFSVEYFQFIKKLAQTNLLMWQQTMQNSDNPPISDEIEDLCLESVKLAFKFLFGVGFRVKKTLRGPVNDWYETIFSYAKYSAKARHWMVQYLLVENSLVIAQYLLDCPSNEIRSVISKILVALIHLSNNDAPLEIKCGDLQTAALSPSISVLVSCSALNSPAAPPTLSLGSLLALMNQSQASVEKKVSLPFLTLFLLHNEQFIANSTF